ncbi:DUF1048 domain-containing protein [Listeria fleischmannii]|uniref:Uncharacterized protein conserved in bacteria n=1 Tax=Listeria fleischmannii subsp. fleischmannii TaxID=1671902 RepID=A0A2X3HLJ2_9LIST|nr:DUF1048 domain-containing protein [Listeria fleischmannii]EMG27691.1 hypothetical protein LFLEISCH_09579 [Listeria fleischmannii subsp. fleischmannii LU2006-1]SQC72024.1 Uncharacterized protein conserved in bacteria [Listeria fleischmannii subsp. fleischmannii]
MTNWFTKYRAEKRAYKAYKKRVDALPAEFRDVMEGIQTYLWTFAGGSGMMEVLTNVLEMFENAVVDGQEVRDVVEEDLADFADSLLNEFPEETWMEKQRNKLRKTLK